MEAGLLMGNEDGELQKSSEILELYTKYTMENNDISLSIQQRRGLLANCPDSIHHFDSRRAANTFSESIRG